MKPIYNQVKDLVSQGKTKEAQAIVNKLSEDDYKAYQKVVSSVKAKETKEAKLKITPVVEQVQKLVASGRKQEAQKIVNSLTDEEYHAYELVVASL